MKLAHVINPVVVDESSDLFVAQPVTFRSMFAAKRWAIDDVDVELMAICYEEDVSMLPARYRQLPLLTRSVLDFGNFKKQRKLPLLRDILEPALANSDADYFIYSNVDISPMPYFYSAIADALSNNDALVINRRTIDKCDSGNQPLSFYYQQSGDSHPGFDCFVFRREHFSKFHLFDACIGANWIGRVFVCNLLAFAENPRIITDAHLTFHLGDDRSWKTVDNIDFDEHNETQVGKLMFELHCRNLCDKHELLERSYQEFCLKTIDPDVTRPNAGQPRSTATTPRSSVDFSIMPRTYLPSHSWNNVDSPVLRQDPVFVVGHPRSGTTLLQSLIATQFTPAIFPETHFFSIVRSLINVAEDKIQTKGLDRATSFISEKLIVSIEFKNYVTQLVVQQQLSPKMMFEALVFDQLSRHLSTDEIRRVRWMEKTPDHAEYMDVMRRFYPDARFVFVVRRPEKAILSRRKHFVWNNESSWPISRHIERWRTTIRSAEEFKQKHPNQILYVKFEDVVANKDYEVARICKFLNIEFNMQSLDNQQQFSQYQSMDWETWKSDAQANVSSEIANGLDASLTESERCELESKLQDYLELFGYSTSQSRAA